MSDLRSKLIRLAHINPEIQPHLLPLLKEARTTNWQEGWRDDNTRSHLGWHIGGFLIDRGYVTEATDPTQAKAIAKWADALGKEIEKRFERVMKDAISGDLELGGMEKPTVDLDHGKGSLGVQVQFTVDTAWIPALIAKSGRRVGLDLNVGQLKGWLAKLNNEYGDGCQEILCEYMDRHFEGKTVELASNEDDWAWDFAKDKMYRQRMTYQTNWTASFDRVKDVDPDGYYGFGILSDIHADFEYE